VYRSNERSNRIYVVSVEEIDATLPRPPAPKTPAWMIAHGYTPPAETRKPPEDVRATKLVLGVRTEDPSAGKREGGRSAGMCMYMCMGMRMCMYMCIGTCVHAHIGMCMCACMGMCASIATPPKPADQIVASLSNGCSETMTELAELCGVKPSGLWNVVTSRASEMVTSAPSVLSRRAKAREELRRAEARLVSLKVTECTAQ
jgi:hypothetical protein